MICNEVKFSVCQWLFQESDVPVGPLSIEMNVLFYTCSDFWLYFTGKINKNLFFKVAHEKRGT